MMDDPGMVHDPDALDQLVTSLFSDISDPSGSQRTNWHAAHALRTLDATKLAYAWVEVLKIQEYDIALLAGKPYSKTDQVLPTVAPPCCTMQPCSIIQALSASGSVFAS